MLKTFLELLQFKMNFKAISYYLSLFCFPVSFLSFVNILYSSYFDYFLNIDSYTFTLVISLSISSLLYVIGRKSMKKLNFFEQILLILAVYIVSSFFISVPYYLSIYQITFVNALFESFSGITSTGFTIFENVKYLDPTLILWRSSSQWIGGLYFFIFLVLIFSNKQFNYKLCYLTYSGEGSNNSENNILKLVFKVFLIYSVLSLFIFILLSFSNIRLFDTLNLSMTLVSNGGFLPTNSLNQIIKNNTQEFVLILSMLVSMLNIFFIFNIFNKKFFFREHQEDFLLIIFFLFFSLIFFITAKNIDLPDILINTLSSISNSGITKSSTPGNMSLYLLLLTLIGGSLISNTSGIKLMRIYILLKSSSSEILKLVQPNYIFNRNIVYSDKKINNEDIKSSFLIFISFFLSIFILSGVLVIDSINFENSFKLSILTLTNTTNSALYGISEMNFANLLTTTKISLIIFMIIGKIELISFFLIIKKIFFRD